MANPYCDLVAIAREARGRAYAPYSGFGVSAALRATDGTVFVGVNVENASYPVGLCAERAALAAAVSAGYREFDAIAIVTPLREGASPCGMCRQALNEFCSQLDMVIAGPESGDPSRQLQLEELLPESFDGSILRG